MKRAYNFQDLTGQRFGLWEVVRLVSTGRATLWSCRCDCGNVREVRAGNLKQGGSTNCGCVRDAETAKRNETHGACGTVEHEIWRGMLKRCASHPRYKKRAPPPEWQDFKNFLRDMGLRPSASHTLERVDNSAPYGPNNCKWATRAEQARNTSRTQLITYNGRTQCQTDWANEIGVDVSAFRRRLAKDTLERAMRPSERKIK
jgi:hypothetical protein